MPHDFVREDVGQLFCEVSDEELSAMAHEKDQKAFSELLNRYTEVMLGKIAYIKPCGMDADDIMQECSLGLLDAVNGYKTDGGASFRTFAGVSMDNRIKSAVRSGARDKNKPLSCYVELSNYYASERADGCTDPEELVLIQESVAELRGYMVSLLSDTEYHVLDSYLSGASYDAIAAELGICAKSVDNALQRVRRKLRRAVAL